MIRNRIVDDYAHRYAVAALLWMRRNVNPVYDPQCNLLHFRVSHPHKTIAITHLKDPLRVVQHHFKPLISHSSSKRDQSLRTCMIILHISGQGLATIVIVERLSNVSHEFPTRNLMAFIICFNIKKSCIKAPAVKH